MLQKEIGGKEEEYPYNYLSIALTSVKGSATFTGKPSKEMLEAVNKMAELAFNKLKKQSTMSQQNEKAYRTIQAEETKPPLKKFVFGIDDKGNKRSVRYTLGKEWSVDIDADDFDEENYEHIESDAQHGCYWLKEGFYSVEEQQGGAYDEIVIRRTIVEWLEETPSLQTALDQLRELREENEQLKSKLLSQ